MHLLSIVIPCFNCERSIRACMDSIADDPRIEVVLVDDCSTDETPLILERYKSEIHSYDIKISSNTRNLGPGETRNEGILLATGEYITFLDSDDEFLPGACGVILEELETLEFDCIFFDAEIEKGESTAILGMFDAAEKPTTPISQEDAIVYGRGCTCGKAYRRSSILSNNVRFCDVPIGEDVAFAKNAYACCERFSYIERPLYLYKENPDSQMHNKDLFDEENYLRIYESVKLGLTEHGFIDELNNFYYQQVMYPTMITMLRKGHSLRICNRRFSEMKRHYKRNDKYFSRMSAKYRIAYYLFSLKLSWVVRYALNRNR